MRMLNLSTYSHPLIHRSNMGLIGSPTPNALGILPPSSKKPCISTRILLTHPSASAAAGAAGQGMLGNNPMPPEETRDPFSGSDLLRERMPKHVAITLDGSRRWSRANNHSQLSYETFCRKNIHFADLCVQWGIPAASCFVFAYCDLKRTDEANNLVFTQLQASLEGNLENFVRQGIRVSIMGEKRMLPRWFQDAIKQVEETTKNGTTLDFRYGIAYGGRGDIVEAARSISKKVKDGEIKPKDINEGLVEQELSTGIDSFPAPDLMIRYGGKRRFSNFYVWQSSHAELYFSDIMGADFEESGLIDALRWFQQCGRRFGK